MKFNFNANFMKGIFKKTGQFMAKNSPVIAASLGVIGLGCAVYSAIKAAPKAKEQIEKAEIEKNNEEIKAAQEESREVHMEPLTKTEKAKIYGKVFLPTIAITAVTATCIVGSVILANRQTAKAMLLYGATATTLEQYKDAAKEVVGENKERAIHDKMVQNKADATPLAEASIIQTGRGNTLCYDTQSGRWFYSSIPAIESTINQLNKTLIETGTVSLNDYFYALGLPEIKQSYMSDTGWMYNVNTGKGDLLSMKCCDPWRVLRIIPTSGETNEEERRPYYAVDFSQAAKPLCELPWD